MTNNRFEKLLRDRDWLLADGATGTNYFSMGLQSGDAPELWNVEHPDRVRLLHQQFIDAGADILLTNSFGGSAYRLKLHQAEHRVEELNAEAAAIARSCADGSSRDVIVAGSMGPTGEILEPVGTLSLQAAENAFADQARALAKGGADVIWLETMSSREELQAARAGAAQSGLLVVATMTFDTNGSTMMGVPPAQLVIFTGKRFLLLRRTEPTVVWVLPIWSGRCCPCARRVTMKMFSWLRPIAAFRSSSMARFSTRGHRS